MLNDIQSSSILSNIKRRGQPIPWGKFGHHGKLRNRIFRNGVAVERDDSPTFLSPSRYRLDRLERALKGANLQFSRGTNRRLDGIGEGEDRLAKRILGTNGDLEESTENRFEDDVALSKTLKAAKDRSKAQQAAIEKVALNTAFDVAATGQYSDAEGDVVKVEKLKLTTAKSRENVGGKNGFNQFVKANSKMGVNSIQGFKTQVKKAKNAASKHLKKVKNAADSMAKSIERLAKRGKAAYKAVVKETAKQVLSSTNVIRKLVKEGRLARKHAERSAKQVVGDAKKLVDGVRSQLKTSFNEVKTSVRVTASSIAKDSVFVGRAKDARNALQDIVLGEIRKSGGGVRQIAKGLREMSALVPGKVGQKLASIGAQARAVANEAQGLRKVETVQAPLGGSAGSDGVVVPGEAGNRIGKITEQVQDIADKIKKAKKVVKSVKSVVASIKKGGIKGALKSVVSKGAAKFAAAKAGVKAGVKVAAKAGKTAIKVVGKALVAMGPVGWAIGAGAALIAFAPAIGRAIGKAVKAIGRFFSCLFGCKKKRKREAERRKREEQAAEAKRKAECLEWIRDGTVDGKLLTGIVDIASRDWLCRNDVVPPLGDALQRGSLEQGRERVVLFLCVFLGC